jgi:hypothetical protein
MEMDIINGLEPKKNFRDKIEKYYTEIVNNQIPSTLLKELIDKITDTQYSNYDRFWKQYPKSRKRYSTLKIEDLEHSFTHDEITDFLKQKDSVNYRKFAKILFSMNDEEFNSYEIRKHQYETK